MKTSGKTVDILGRHRSSSVSLIGMLKIEEFKETYKYVPGGAKMVCGSIFLGVVIWMSLHFGSHLSLSNVDVNGLPFSMDFTDNDLPSKDRSTRSVPEPIIDVEDHILQNSVNFATGIIDRMARLESSLVTADVKVRLGTPTHGQLLEWLPSQEALMQGKDSLTALKASSYIVQHTCLKYGLSKSDCRNLISSLSMNSTSLGDKCLNHGPDNSCLKSSKYRTADGSCNNLEDASLGKSFTGYRRLLKPLYGDGIQQPRTPVSGGDLPSARKVSVAVTEDSSSNIDTLQTLALTLWTQFIEHDLTHTPVSKMVHTGQSIMCCEQDGSSLLPRYVHPSCMPIKVPDNDPFYSQYDVSCMNYVRSLTAIRSDCSFGPAEQINQATHFLDGSMVYGSTAEKARLLRSFSGGKLSAKSINGRSFLPLATDKSECQFQSGSFATCYRSGDTRANEHPHLAVMHAVWLREHNRIATELSALNPHWTDDKLYNEAKRIVIAEIQHITYKEWLPLVLGDKYAKKRGLGLKSSGYSDDYSENIDATVSNSFATAALRFLHSMMDGDLKLYKENRDANSSLDLSLHFNKPRVIEERDNFDSLLRGLATQRSQKNDLKFIEDVTNLLYKGNSEYGLDALSLDIQRGRDHGLPGYNYYRKHCGLPKAKKFETFEDYIPKTIAQKLKSVYVHPDDVDLVVGGMAEKPSDGSLVGPTFRCIIAEQMLRTKRGDRFFYEVGGKKNSFTESQLTQIRKTSLARVICDNSDDIKSLQPNVFEKSLLGNSLVSCQESTKIPRVSLIPWREVTTSTA